MNILLTCAGRRNYLVNYFKDALGKNGEIYTADISNIAPTMIEAENSFVVPPVNQPGYFEHILSISLQNNVGIIISLNDLELPLLARKREEFVSKGIIPIVSSPSVIDTCFDKLKTAQYLNGLGVMIPATFTVLKDVYEALDTGVVNFPLVIKPRWGTASIGIEYVEDKEELELAYRFVRKRIFRSFLADVSTYDKDNCVLIQEKLTGFEYGLDVVNDLDGQWHTVFVKQKLAMRAGETDRAVTVENSMLYNLGSKIGSALGHVGNLDCDVFMTEQGPVVLEMNPRFGGGYPFSHVAGANIPAALLAWARGDDVNPEWLQVKPGIVSAKCDRLVVRDIGSGARHI
jgi:carbamoyl-phosphate synthase large subunit